MQINKIFFSKFASHFYLLVIILAAVTILWLLLFLYQNVYQSITQSKAIVILKQEVAMESIDRPLFDKIKAGLIKKKEPPQIDWAALRDPFSSR